MQNSKKNKYTNKLKEIGPKLKWVLLNGLQDYKLNAKYIDFICPDPKEKNPNPTAKLHALIKEMLIAEFSPEIQNTKYFNFLVDAVAHNIKKKALKE
jgi:hypothetical protein